MQRQQQATLPGEFAAASFPRRARPQGSRTSPTTMPATGATRQPPEVHAPPPVAATATIARGERTSEAALMQDFRARNPMVNMDEYFLGVLSQFREDSAVMNPMGIAIRGDQSESRGVAQTESQSVITQLTGPAPPTPVDLLIPIGHSAIDDTRIFFDTLILSQAYAGYPTGEIPMQFTDFNGTGPPDRVVQIHLASFNFPHIYTPETVTFDMFYFRTVYMTIRFVPTTHLTQSAQPNRLFTFELAVDNIDSSAVYLRPLEPVFCLKQPITVIGDMTVRFHVRAPSGGFVGCPIPPTRIRVRRTAAVGGTTTFTIIDGSYIGVIAPPGAIYTVPILFQRVDPSVPITPLETLLVDMIGVQSSNFTAGSTFDVPVNTAAIAIGADDFFVFIPKNGVSFSVRFSSLQPTRTNDLFPVHS